MKAKNLIFGISIPLLFSFCTVAEPVTSPDFQLDVPTSWERADNGETYPYAITHSSGDAELLIFRSDLELSQSINTANELKLSVQRVIDSVILSLPNSKLISNTGFNETDRIGFALEFVSADAESGAILRHRMMGWLYRHTDGHQILFTLWGKGVLQNYQQFEGELLQMQTGFAYVGPSTAIALASGIRNWALPAVVILMAIGGLFYFRSAKNGRKRRENFNVTSWVCGCGSRNTTAIHQCRRCGQARTSVKVR